MGAIAIAGGALIEWGVSGRELTGESRSGDLHVVTPFPGGVLVAAVDGLGHGEEAAFAAEVASSTLRRHAGEALPSLVLRCHEELKTTRGVAMSIASLPEVGGQMAWIGVGNVEASLFRADPGSDPKRESLPLRSGVVGYRLPRLLQSTVSIRAGDVLVLATDGVEGGSFDGMRNLGAPQAVADDLLARFAKGTDDALVLVVRYRGPAT